jgi:hypothetical protein
MSRALDSQLESTALIPSAYCFGRFLARALIVQLLSDRDFIAFKGFGVKVTTAVPLQLINNGARLSSRSG